MTQTEKILAKLDEHKVEYEYVEHPPVMTIDEFKQYEVYSMGLILKNLFLRDDTGKKTFLLTCRPDTKTDLGGLAKGFGVKKVSFASSDRLMKYLQLLPGAVSPMGLVFDEGKAVSMVFDATLRGYEGKVGIHPGSNDATVFMTFGALCGFLEGIGVKFKFVEL